MQELEKFKLLISGLPPETLSQINGIVTVYKERDRLQRKVWSLNAELRALKSTDGGK